MKEYPIHKVRALQILRLHDETIISLHTSNISLDDGPIAYNQRFLEAVLLITGTTPPKELIDSWIKNESDELQNWIGDHGPWWCQNIGVLDAAQALADAPIEGEPEIISYDRCVSAEPNDKLMELAATMYQCAGAYGMPERVMDMLSAAQNGEDFSTEGVLPVPAPVAIGWGERLEELLGEYEMTDGGGRYYSPSNDERALIRDFVMGHIEDLIPYPTSSPSALDKEKPTIPLNDHTKDILGRPSFMCIKLAALLRLNGYEIPKKAEEEQAASIHYLLCKYMEFGAAWQEEAEKELQIFAESAKQGGEE